MPVELLSRFTLSVLDPVRTIARGGVETGRAFPDAASGDDLCTPFFSGESVSFPRSVDGGAMLVDRSLHSRLDNVVGASREPCAFVAALRSPGDARGADASVVVSLASLSVPLGWVPTPRKHDDNARRNTASPEPQVIDRACSFTSAEMVDIAKGLHTVVCRKSFRMSSTRTGGSRLSPVSRRLTSVQRGRDGHCVAVQVHRSHVQF